MRDLDDIKLCEIYTESFKRMASLGAAIIGGALTAGISDTDLAQLWSRYYQSTNNPQKEKRALQVINSFDTARLPNDAEHAINTAIYIFGGDMGVPQEVLKDVLIYTGAIESGYKTKSQYGGGPAQSYWQVEPETAIDLLINSKSLFGNKFKKTFGETAQQLLNIKDKSPKNLQVVSNLLKNNDELGASFAAAKWITSAHKDLRKY
jgi:hypothetical protein